MPSPYIVEQDVHNVVHIRRRDTRECVGCIEGGLYWIIQALIQEEVHEKAEVALR